MAVSHAQKVAVLQHLQEDVVSQKSVLLLNTDKAEASLSAFDNASLRKKAKEKGVTLKVVKNTLIKLVFDDVSEFPEEFTGQTYLAYLDNKEESDEVTVPKAMVDLVTKDFKDNIKIMGGVVDGQFYGEADVIKLSKTPTHQESMGILAGMLKQLGGGKIATLIKEIPSQVGRGVSEYSKTLS